MPETTDWMKITMVFISIEQKEDLFPILYF